MRETSFTPIPRRRLRRYVSPRRGETRGTFRPLDIVVVRLMLKFDDDDGERENRLTVVASCVILSVRGMDERERGEREFTTSKRPQNDLSNVFSSPEHFRRASVHAQNRFRRDGFTLL